MILIGGKYYPFSSTDNDLQSILDNNEGIELSESELQNYVVSNGDMDGDTIKSFSYQEYLNMVATEEDSEEPNGIHNLTLDEIEQINTEQVIHVSYTDLTDPYLLSLNQEQLDDLLETEKYYIQMLKDKFGESTEWYVRYVKNTTSGIYEPYFYKQQELQEATFHGEDTQLSNISCFTLGSAVKTKEILNQTGTIEKDSSGRYVAITLFDKDNNPTTYTLTTTTSTDEEAYNDAMNQYHFAQHEYDHKVQEINSKLEIIQAQDKQLELKLKQLDTEENAISTEMDAVKKVISKNVESSFKTFNA